MRELGERPEYVNSPGGKRRLVAVKEAGTRAVQEQRHGARRARGSFGIHKRPCAPLTRQKTKCTGILGFQVLIAIKDTLFRV